MLHRLMFLAVGMIAFLSCSARAYAAVEQRSAEARIDRIESAACERPEQKSCQVMTVTITTGPTKGQTVTIHTDEQSFLAGRPVALSQGQGIILETGDVQGEQRYAFSDVLRRRPLLLLVVLFCALAVITGGIASARALVGMLASFVLLFAVILPMILRGYAPLPVALIGSMVIMAVTFLITHGWNAKMQSALVGTCLSLLLTALLAWVFSGMAQIMGLADESALFVLSSLPELNTRGLLLAGIIIGALGSLDDVTISQASAVFELKRANPILSRRQISTQASRIGRDHIAGAINTLVLAYAGAALPLLLLIVSDSSHESWLTLISRETFATEILRMMVGSIGLLAAVPLTTFVASILAEKIPSKDVSVTGHHH